MATYIQSYVYPYQPSVGENIHFIVEATSPLTSLYVEFGDGNTSNSLDPYHIYNTADTYSVYLEGIFENADTFSDTISVTVDTAAGVADFTYNPDPAYANQEITFTDTSTGNPVDWTWDFGDGTSVTGIQNPTHTYTNTETRTVTLQVTYGDATNFNIFKTVPVSEAVIAVNFNISNINPSLGEELSFTDTSTTLGKTITDWAWSFGDGETSTLQNPTHTYTVWGAGYVYVDLIITFDDLTTATSTQWAHGIVFVAQGTASFDLPLNPIVSIPLLFLDTSTGNPASWAWDFGDGETSTDQSPTHTYATTGLKTVVLTTTYADTSQSSSSQDITIQDAIPPTSSFTKNSTVAYTWEPLCFKSTSTGQNPVTCSWSITGGIGENYTTSGEHIHHFFETAGTKTIQLIVTDTVTQLTDSSQQTVDISTGIVDFIMTTPSQFVSYPAHEGIPKQLINLSTVTAVSWLWEFDEGGPSTEFCPIHTFSEVRYHDITLTATLLDGSTLSVTKSDTVNTNEPSVPEELWNVESLIPFEVTDNYSNPVIIVTDPLTSPICFGAPHTEEVVITGGTTPYTYTVQTENLPPGITFNEGTSTFEGTPTLIGTYTFDFSVTDAQYQTTSTQYTIEVINCVTLEIVTTELLSPHCANTFYTQTIEATGGVLPYTFSIENGDLPTGLVLDTETGVIEGTPIYIGTYIFDCVVVDAVLTEARKTYTIETEDCTVYEVKILTEYLKKSKICLNAPYSEYILIVGGTLPFSFSIDNGILPYGLFVNAGLAQIIGTPEAAGVYTFDFTVIDAHGSIDTKTYTIEVLVCEEPVQVLPSCMSEVIVVKDNFHQQYLYDYIPLSIKEFKDS